MNRRGLWEESGVSEDPETGDEVKSIYFQEQPTKKAKPLSPPGLWLLLTWTMTVGWI